MALRFARADTGPHMPTSDRTSSPPPTGPASPGASWRRDAVRLLAIVLSVIALILTSSALNWVTEARAADGPRRAVVVAGPVHSLTDRYKGYCSAIAQAAEAQGMEVVRIFHPWAPASKVRTRAQGADLFVYCGHGNGWPSPYGPYQEDTKNGLGLDVADKTRRSPNNVAYKGANWLRDNLTLAPNAVVILSHLSYASGNASSGMPIPTRAVAVQRVDNFANGFLSIGARVVWALGWQPGADIVDALHNEDATMDAVFRTRYRSAVNPLNGWIGWKPGYYDSERIPGAVVHIDPDPDYGFLRGITGDLEFTTTEWRDAEAAPVDTDPPVLTGVRASQEKVTLASAKIPVFTPNGDGLSDRIAVDYELSESAYLEVKIKRDGSAVRRWDSWALEGSGRFTWNGRKNNGDLAPEGNYNLYLTPTDRAGNVGQTAVVKVKLLNSIRNPRVNPGVFWARDGDELAATTVLKARLTREATVTWTVRDDGGAVVRRGLTGEARQPGDVRFVWDGRDDAGRYVPDARYTARIWVQRPAGSYAHEVTLRQTPYTAWSRSWTYDRGARVVIKLTSTEPLTGKPVVTASQPGIPKYTVPKWKVKRLSATEFTLIIDTQAKGRAGDMRVRVKGTDTGGGATAKVFTVRLR